MPKGIYKRTKKHREKISEGLKGRHPSEKTKKKISKSNIGKHHPSKEIRRKLSKSHKGKKNAFYGKHHIEAARKKMRENSWMKGRGWCGKDNPMYGKFLSEETKRKVGEKAKEMWRTKDMTERNKKTSEKLRGKNNHFWGKNGKKSLRYGKTPPHGKGAYYKGIWMRSSWEIKIAEWLDKQNWKWLYEPKRFELKNKTYCPDFYLPDLNVWWEIKGWFHKRHQETIKQFRELYPYEKLVVVTKEVYEEVLHC